MPTRAEKFKRKSDLVAHMVVEHKSTFRDADNLLELDLKDIHEHLHEIGR